LEVSIVAVGGYNAVGRNMTAVRVKNEIVIMDMGLRLDMVQLHEDVEIDKLSSDQLIAMSAIPDDTVLSGVGGRVVAICCTHGHLDHIGAIPKLAAKYDCPIIATPFTAALIRKYTEKDGPPNLQNSIMELQAGKSFEISKNITLEFIRVQHSIPDCVFAALHTPSGIVLYACDFKVDRTPVVGEPPDFKRLKKMEGEDVLVMITEALNVNRTGKTPSERVARELILDALVAGEETKRGVLVSTFSSNIARLSSIIEAARLMDRTPMILGRSLERYYLAAQKLGIIPKADDVKIFNYRRTIDQALKRIMKEGKEKYLPIVTGHQGEPGAVLTRIASGTTPYEVTSGDKVVFSASIIPNELTIAQRKATETKLSMKGARIYRGVHVSGHASRDDHWELLNYVQPENIIPAHGTLEMHSAYVGLAEELGYKLGDDVHLLRNGQEITFGG